MFAHKIQQNEDRLLNIDKNYKEVVCLLFMKYKKEGNDGQMEFIIYSGDGTGTVKNVLES